MFFFFLATSIRTNKSSVHFILIIGFLSKPHLSVMCKFPAKCKLKKNYLFLILLLVLFQIHLCKSCVTKKKNSVCIHLLCKIKFLFSIHVSLSHFFLTRFWINLTLRIYICFSAKQKQKKNKILWFRSSFHVPDSSLICDIFCFCSLPFIENFNETCYAIISINKHCEPCFSFMFLRLWKPSF